MIRLLALSSFDFLLLRKRKKHDASHHVTREEDDVAAKDKRENASTQRAVEAISRIETLIKAIQKGTLEEVIKSCIAFRDQTEVLTARDVKGRGCLHLIAQRRDVAAVDICKHLVETIKCDVEMRDADGATALLIAMSRANALVLEYLLVDGKADALVTSKDERNAWHYLAEWDGGRERARETADVLMTKCGGGPERVKAVKRMLEKKASGGNTGSPFLFAVGCGSHEVAKLLSRELDIEGKRRRYATRRCSQESALWC